MTHEKLCLCCKHLELDFGSRGYGEMTPGDPPSFNCNKGHFEIRVRYPENFGVLIQRAKTCKDFEHR
jgi:hypothetical protein